MKTRFDPTMITLFTDAGFCPHTNVASWAAWAKRDGVTIRKSGQLKGFLDGSDLAEMRALANGIAFVLSSFKPEKGDRILAQTDCQSAINALLGTGYRKKAQQERVKGAIEAVRDRLQKSGVTIAYKHVKGHAGNGTARTAVNEWCDYQCKKHLRQARIDVRKKEKDEE